MYMSASGGSGARWAGLDATRLHVHASQGAPQSGKRSIPLCRFQMQLLWSNGAEWIVYMTANIAKFLLAV